MKKHIGLVFIIFGFIYHCSGQIRTIIRENQYKLQPNSDSTSNLLITKRRAKFRPITMVLDDRDTFFLVPKRIENNFLLQNIPIGEHKVFVSSKKVRKYKDSLNYTFHFQADGTGRTLQQKLPKLRYNNATPIANGFAYTNCAALVSLLVVAAQYGRN